MGVQALMESNPVYQRLMRKGGGLSKPAYTRLSVGMGVVTGALSLAAFIFDPKRRGPLSIVHYAVFVAALAVVVLTPFITLIFTAVTVANDVVHEDFGLLRLTNVTPKDVVIAYHGAANTRLAIMRAICLGLIPGFALSFAHMFALFDLDSSQLGNWTEQWIVGLMLAFIPLSVIGFITMGLWWAARSVGVWASIRWRHNGPMVALGMAIGSLVLALGIPLSLIVLGALQSVVVSMLCTTVCCLVGLSSPIVIFIVGLEFIDRSEGYIESQWSIEGS